MKTLRKSPNVRSPSELRVRESLWESANVAKDTLGNLREPIFKFCGGKVENERCVPFKPPPTRRMDPGGIYWGLSNKKGAFVPESSFKRTGRIPSDSRAEMISDLKDGPPLDVSVDVTSAICGPFTYARIAAESSRQSRL